MVSKKKIVYDRHAKRRMKWRKISQTEIESALNNPDVVKQAKKGRVNAFKQVGTKYIKITYKQENGIILIISAVNKND